MSPRRRFSRSHRRWRKEDLIDNEEYEHALEVLSRVRQGETLTDASDAVGIHSRRVRHYVDDVLEQDDQGQWVALPNDRLYRRTQWLDAHGRTMVEPANYREASKLSDYWHAVDLYLWLGDSRSLRAFQSKRLRTRQKQSLRFLTDLDLIERFAYAGELSFESLYQD
jgi:hypothetical protein